MKENKIDKGSINVSKKEQEYIDKSIDKGTKYRNTIIFNEGMKKPLSTLIEESNAKQFYYKRDKGNKTVIVKYTKEKHKDKDNPKKFYYRINRFALTLPEGFNKSNKESKTSTTDKQSTNNVDIIDRILNNNNLSQKQKISMLKELNE